MKNSSVEEVIVVLKPSIEGETTTQYIKKILEKYNVKVSKIATGIAIIPKLKLCLENVL